MSKTLTPLLTLLLTPLLLSAADTVRFHSIASDTLRLNSLLAQASHITDTSHRIQFLASQFIDTPYQAGTLDTDSITDIEPLSVNLDGLDCTTFVETVAALNAAAADRRLSWRDFLYCLETIRYRSGVATDYASRLHYISDWVIDNSYRGLLTDITSSIPGAITDIRKINYMSTHADRYPRLADPEQLARIRRTEENFRHYQSYILRSSAVSRKAVNEALHTGDIVAFVTRVKGLDVSHIGFIIKDADSVPHLLHASSAAKKVTLETASLTEYLHRNPSITGIRIFRLQ